MKTQFYFPAPVEVVKVTNENLADVAKWCGGKVASTESRRVPGRQDSYVWVPTPKGTAISWAFPGMYITKRLAITIKDEMKATYAVFRRDYFTRNFFDTPTEASDKTWEKLEKETQKAEGTNIPKPAPPKKQAEFKSKQEIMEMGKTINQHRADAGLPEFGKNPGAHIETPVDPQKEHDMEKSKHGYPVLTEEEAIERKEFAKDLSGEPQVHDLSIPWPDGKCSPDCDGGHPVLTPELEAQLHEQAVENIKEAFPGAEVIEETGTIEIPSDADVVAPEDEVEQTPEPETHENVQVKDGQSTLVKEPFREAVEASDPEAEQNVVSHGNEGFNAGSLD